MTTTTEVELTPPSRQGLCEFPGVNCPKPKQVEPGTPGRPPKYCGLEEPGPDGKPVVHNKANAWTAKNSAPKRPARQSGKVIAEQNLPAGPVTTARVTLEQLMKDNLPQLVGELESHLAQLAEAVRTYGDAEAVAAEVGQLQAASRAQLADVERQRAEEEHRRRQAEQQAADDQDARDEADAAAQEAVTALAMARNEADAAAQEAVAALDAARAGTAASEAVAEQARQDAVAARKAAAAEVQQARDEAEQRTRDLQAAADQQIQQARGEAEAARIAQAAAEADRHTAQQAAEQLRTELRQERERHRTELDSLRSEHRADRDQLRADHQAQLADVKQSAEHRVAAVTAAQRSAEQMADDLRRQLAEPVAAEPIAAASAPE